MGKKFNKIYVCFFPLLLFVLAGSPLFGQDTNHEIEIHYVSRTAAQWYFGYDDDFDIHSGDELLLSLSESQSARATIDAVSSKYIAARFMSDPPELLQKDKLYEAILTLKPRPVSSAAEVKISQPMEEPVRVDVKREEQQIQVSEELPAVLPELNDDEQESAIASPRQQIRGVLSMQYYSSNDLNRSNFDFRQPSAILKFYGRNLGGTNWELRVHTRSREDRRRQFGRTSYKSEYFHRIYEAALKYDNARSRFGLQVGRLFASHLISIGYLDGVIASVRAYPWMEAGGFAGTQPDIDRGDLNTDVVKSGGYLRFMAGGGAFPFYTGTIAATHQTRDGELDRDFLYLQNRLQLLKKITLYQSGELNIQRDWRKSLGNTIDLANLYTTLQYTATDKLRLGLQYDARKNYRTLLNRTVPDSLFDDHLRQGGSVRLSYRVSRGTRIYGTVGSRGRSGDGRTTSYSAGVHHLNFFGSKIRGTLRLSGFNSSSAKGFNPSLSAGRRLTGFWDVDISGGYYRYQVTGWTSRNTQWLRLRQSWDILRRWYVSAEIEYNNGDDAESFQTFLHTGVRF